MLKCFSILITSFLLIMTTSCQSQNRDQSLSDLQKKDKDKNGSSKDKDKNKGSETSFPPFDAFMIWKTGNGLDGTNGVFRYPLAYDSPRIPEGTEIDDVFYDNTKFSVMTDHGVDDWDGWRGEPTKGTKIVNGALVYPEKEGRNLVLNFSEITDDAIKKTHVEARAHCESQGMRLPTIRELFDYCTADKNGVKQKNESKRHANEKIADRFPDNRCVSKRPPTNNDLLAPVPDLWTASIAVSWRGSRAWTFDSKFGDVGTNDRSFIGVRTICVKN